MIYNQTFTNELNIRINPFAGIFLNPYKVGKSYLVNLQNKIN